MAMKYNVSTGEWEEEEESTTLGTGNLPGVMPELAPFQIDPQVGTGSIPPSSVVPSTPWSYDGGDWVRQSGDGLVEARDLAGLWNPLGRGEHAESWGYTGSAVNDPTVDKLFAYKAANPTGLNTEQQAFFSNPILGLDSYGQGSRWGGLDLFDNQFNPQQAGALMTTGGGGYLSESDRAAGGNFNFEQSAAEQHKRAGGDDGLDIGTMIMLASAIYGGGALAGLWGGAGAAGAGGASAALGAGEGAAALSAADLAGVASVSPYAAEAAYGLGSAELAAGAGGLGAASDLADPGYADTLGDWASPISNAGGMEVGLPDFLPEDLGSLFDTNAINGLDLPEMAMPSTSFDLPAPDAFNIFNPTTDGYGMGIDTLSPDVSSLSTELYGPPQASEIEGLYIDDYGGGTNAMGEFVNGRGNRSLLDNISNTMRDLGVDRETAAKLTQGGKSVFNTLTKPLGGSKYGPTPIGVGQGLAKLYGAYNSEKTLDDTIGRFQGMYDKASNFQDPNRARGDEANRLWMENYNNPRAGYNEFMTGAGRDFTNQARAAAAKSGKRGSYLNSGKMQSDLASLFMKNQLQRGDSLSRGFAAAPNNQMEALRYAPGLMDMYQKQGGSMGMAVQDILQSTAGKGLVNNILDSYW